ncbi:MAG: hypothetical protein ACXV5F_09465 [Halobacteriota archaeon]
MSILTDIIATLDLSAEVRDSPGGIPHESLHGGAILRALPKDALKQTPHMIKEPGCFLEESLSELHRYRFSTASSEPLQAWHPSIRF